MFPGRRGSRVEIKSRAQTSSCVLHRRLSLIKSYTLQLAARIPVYLVFEFGFTVRAECLYIYTYGRSERIYIRINGREEREKKNGSRR